MSENSMKNIKHAMKNEKRKCTAVFHSAFFIACFIFFILPGASADAPAASYKITQIPAPEGSPLEVGGMDWMPDGRLMICTRRGEVWSLSASQWTLFASGLQEALYIGYMVNTILPMHLRTRVTPNWRRCWRMRTIFRGKKFHFNRPMIFPAIPC